MTTEIRAQKQTRRPGGEPLDPLTRAQLAEYLRTVHWRRGARDLRLGPGAIRRALKGEVVRCATAAVIRMGLALAAKQESRS